MTSATERLRELLDERGVRWAGFWVKTMKATSFRHDDIGWTATEHPSGDLYLTSTSITPEQAIAATLWNVPYVGLKQGKVRESHVISEYYCGCCGYPVTDHDSYCSECGGALHESAATLGNDQHPYQLCIRGDGDTWAEIMKDALDDLVSAAAESCTPDEMREFMAHLATLGSGECDTRWHELFGTPEKTAMTMAGKCCDCCECVITDECKAEECLLSINDDEAEAKLLGWLRGKAVEQ